MSFTPGNAHVVGSNSLKSQLYAGDYDALEYVDFRTIGQIVQRFQDIIREVTHIPSTFIADIKCGSVDEWVVVPPELTPENYTKLRPSMRARLSILKQEGIIQPEEYREAIALLPKTPLTLYQVLSLKKAIRFNVLRWKPADILAGHLTHRGYTFDLEKVLGTPIITKLDVVSWVNNNRYTDFSIIYLFKVSGIPLNVDVQDFVPLIQNDCLTLMTEGKYYKAAKRIFALTRILKPINTKLLSQLTQIFNSDLGIIYQIKSDIETLESISNHREVTRQASLEIALMIGRLANVQESLYLKQEDALLTSIRALAKDPFNSSISTHVIRSLDQILNQETLSRLNTIHLYSPLPAKYLPSFN
jgi:hypothetical protein